MDNNTLKKRASIKDVLESGATDEKEQNDARPDKPKEIIKERVVVEYRDKPRGCLNGCGCGCKTLGCGIFLILLLFIIGIVYLFAEKPPFIWSEVVSYLNSGEHPPVYQTEDLNIVQEGINTQIETLGDVEISLTQNQVTTLLRQNVTQLKDVTVEIDPEIIKFYWYLDNSLPSKPLYGIIQFSNNNENTLEISKIGTGKIALPEGLNRLATNAVYSALNLSGEVKNPAEALFKGIFKSENLNVKAIKFEDGVVKIEANIQVNLFQQ